MSALDRLKEKIEAWKTQVDVLEKHNKELETQLKEAATGSDEVEKLRATLGEYEATITALRNEIQEKDDEIEEIIAKVEALLA